MENLWKTLVILLVYIIDIVDMVCYNRGIINLKKGIMTKASLDKLMQEYDYPKNTLEDTLYFLSFMFEMYDKLNNKED